MTKSPEQMPAVLELPATMEGLNSALDAVEKYCAGMNRDLVSRARIVVEELFSNTIKYGYGGECDKAIRLSLASEPLTMIYEDDAPSFDPTVWQPQDALAPDVRPEGQAGIAMIMGLCTQVRYQSRDGKNRLLLIFA